MRRYIRYDHLWQIHFQPLTDESSGEYKAAIQKLLQVGS